MSSFGDAFTPIQRPGHRIVRSRHVAVRLNLRVIAYAAITAVLVLLLATWAMTLGSVRIPFTDVVMAMVGRREGDTDLVVQTLRLPRMLSAILIGASLAIAGAIFQGLARNPLVSPDIIGIDAGATLCAVFWLVTGQNANFLPLAAFIGATVTATSIYALSWRGGIVPDRLILVGIGFGSMVSAGATFMTVRFPEEMVRPAIVWTMGSIYGSKWSDVVTVGVVLAVAAPISIILMIPLRALQLGDALTRSVGIPLERTRLGLILIGCALAAVSVSFAGPIGFVALMVPHMARMIAGPPSGSVMVFTGFLGALMLLASDVVAQHALPVTLPVGVVTAAVGAPYFFFLLYRANARV